MTEALRTQSAPPAKNRRRPSSSFLVRIWHERREIPGASPVLRAYVRDLESGEETYLAGADALGDHLRARSRSGDEPSGT